MVAPRDAVKVHSEIQNAKAVRPAFKDFAGKNKILSPLNSENV